MFSHVMIGARDVPAMAAFYDAVLGAIGLRRYRTAPDGRFVGWQGDSKYPTFWVGLPFDGQPATVSNGSMNAFLAPNRAAVDAAHAAGLAHGGKDEGAPGLRPHYGSDYYGAYLRDPEGNKLHFVYEGA